MWNSRNLALLREQRVTAELATSQVNNTVRPLFLLEDHQGAPQRVGVGASYLGTKWGRSTVSPPLSVLHIQGIYFIFEILGVPGSLVLFILPTPSTGTQGPPL